MLSLLNKISRDIKILISLCFISLFSLVLVSRLIGLFFLLLCTLYLLYKREYENIVILWSVFFFGWYLAFAACMWDWQKPIEIKPHFWGFFTQSEETIYLYRDIEKMYDSFSSLHGVSNATFGRFRFETFALLSLLSFHLEITIYVPSIFKGLLFVFYFLLFLLIVKLSDKFLK